MEYFGFQEGRFVFSFWLNKSSIHTVGISPAYVSVQRHFGFGTIHRKKAPLFADRLQRDVNLVYHCLRVMPSNEPMLRAATSIQYGW